MHIDHVTCGYTPLDKLKEISNKKHYILGKAYFSHTENYQSHTWGSKYRKKMMLMEKEKRNDREQREELVFLISNHMGEIVSFIFSAPNHLARGI